jgi:predicted secreted protein
MNTLARRSVAAALAITALLLAVVAFGQSRAGEAADLVRGTSFVIELPGHPSTGYVWQLDAAQSANASIVRIEDLGYTAREPAPGEKPRVGAPASYRFRITGSADGTAELAFAYLQPWVGTPARTERQTVRVRAP